MRGALTASETDSAPLAARQLLAAAQSDRYVVSPGGLDQPKEQTVETIRIIAEDCIYEVPASVGPDEALQILRFIQWADARETLEQIDPATYRLVKRQPIINLLDPFRLNDRLIAALGAGPMSTRQLWNAFKAEGWTLTAVQKSLDLLTHRGLIVKRGGIYSLPEAVSSASESSISTIPSSKNSAPPQPSHEIVR